MWLQVLTKLENGEREIDLGTSQVLAEWRFPYPAYVHPRAAHATILP
jgi:hypothetical protein